MTVPSAQVYSLWASTYARRRRFSSASGIVEPPVAAIASGVPVHPVSSAASAGAAPAVPPSPAAASSAWAARVPSATEPAIATPMEPAAPTNPLLVRSSILDPPPVWCGPTGRRSAWDATPEPQVHVCAGPSFPGVTQPIVQPFLRPHLSPKRRYRTPPFGVVAKSGALGHHLLNPPLRY